MSSVVAADTWPSISGEGLPIYHVSQSNGGKRVAQVVEVHMLLDAGLSSRMRLILATAAGIQ